MIKQHTQFLINKWGMYIDDGTSHISVALIWHFADILITDIEKYFQADKLSRPNIRSIS